MSLKKISAVLVALIALGAIVASSASAAVSTTRAEWYTGTSPGTTLPVGTDETINLEMIEHPVEGKNRSSPRLSQGCQ